MNIKTKHGMSLGIARFPHSEWIGEHSINIFRFLEPWRVQTPPASGNGKAPPADLPKPPPCGYAIASPRPAHPRVRFHSRKIRCPREIRMRKTHQTTARLLRRIADLSGSSRGVADEQPRGVGDQADGDLAHSDTRHPQRPGRAGSRGVDEYIPHLETARLQSHRDPRFHSAGIRPHRPPAPFSAGCHFRRVNCYALFKVSNNHLILNTTSTCQ